MCLSVPTNISQQTGWYNQAFSETVLESLNFEYHRNTDWRCILGGSQVLAEKMKDTLKINKQDALRLELNKPVTKIKSGSSRHMELTVKGEKEPRVYNAVLNSAPLGCLQQINTSKANLNYTLKQAIRTLTYGPSAKVGNKFKRTWWIHNLRKYNIKQAGLKHSDLRIRTCVYPSYNLNNPAGESAVLLCLYT